MCGPVEELHDAGDKVTRFFDFVADAQSLLRILILLSCCALYVPPQACARSNAEQRPCPSKWSVSVSTLQCALGHVHLAHFQDTKFAVMVTARGLTVTVTVTVTVAVTVTVMVTVNLFSIQLFPLLGTRLQNLDRSSRGPRDQSSRHT